MKTLIVVRHAKSSWALIGQKDFDRPLSDRGKKDAPAMAQRLLDEKVTIDAFVSSPAKRARKTCRAFAEAYGKTKEDIILTDELYHATVDIFYKTVSALDNTANSIAVFSHNPGITSFISSLCADVHVDNMPTCGVFAVQADIDDWKDFEKAQKGFLFFKKPKEE